MAVEDRLTDTATKLPLTSFENHRYFIQSSNQSFLFSNQIRNHHQTERYLKPKHYWGVLDTKKRFVGTWGFLF